MTYALLIPAAGRGERFGGERPKALALLAGKPLIEHVFRAFSGDERLLEIVVAASQEIESEIQAAAVRSGLGDKLTLVVGGTTRQDSVGNALAAATSKADHILVHDAARPLVSRVVVNRVLVALEHSTAAVPGLAATDTIKRADAYGNVIETLPRLELFQVQTPQGIRAQEFRKAHMLAQRDRLQSTDDVALIEHFKLGTVRLVEGDPANFKITHPHELTRAESFLRTPFVR